MRKNCKNCGEPTSPSKKPGARHVYCIACDRQSARERMRDRRGIEIASKAKSMYYRPKHGYVYVIYNPNFPGWIKVGCALNANDRLNAFQTASPFRDFQLKWAKKSSNKLMSETSAHLRLESLYERRGEWFKTTPSKAIRVLERLEWK